MNWFTERINKAAADIVDLVLKKASWVGKNASFIKNSENLSLLYPGQEGSKLAGKYYIKKTASVIMAVIAMGILTLLVILNRMTSDAVTDDKRIRRHDIGSGNYSIDIKAKTEDYDYGVLTIEVDEKRLDDESRDHRMDELYDYLVTYIVSDNKSLEHIDRDMILPASVEGYPFSLRWESSDYMLVNTLGEVDNENLDESGTPIDLRVVMTYGDYEKTYDIKAVIYPPEYSEDELLHIQLNEKIKKEDGNSRFDDYCSLPESIDGKPIEWKENKEPIVPLLLAVMICLGIGIWFGMDRDMKKKCMERDRQLIVDYAEFVSKLQVLLTSGSTIRGALERMLADYKISINEGGKKRYVYEELYICVRKLSDGMSETGCYEYFGRRCGVVCYRKLSSLLIQNLKKGTDGLIETLNNEVTIAFEERKALARRMGEESQTKLMLPMMLMLSVVMIIIMIPAYLSFGGL